MHLELHPEAQLLPQFEHDDEQPSEHPEHPESHPEQPLHEPPQPEQLLHPPHVLPHVPKHKPVHAPRHDVDERVVSSLDNFSTYVSNSESNDFGIFIPILVSSIDKSPLSAIFKRGFITLIP